MNGGGGGCTGAGSVYPCLVFASAMGVRAGFFFGPCFYHGAFLFVCFSPVCFRLNHGAKTAGHDEKAQADVTGLLHTVSIHSRTGAILRDNWGVDALFSSNTVPARIQ